MASFLKYDTGIDVAVRNGNANGIFNADRKLSSLIVLLISENFIYYFSHTHSSHPQLPPDPPPFHTHTKLYIKKMLRAAMWFEIFIYFNDLK